MTRARLIFALVLSITLVGAAGWIRLSRSSTVHVANLLATDDNADLQANVSDIAEVISTPTDEASSTPLTDTSLIGRQLFSDFFGMISNGQVTEDNINVLASTYADSVGNLDKSSRISPTDLAIVADTSDNFNAYLVNLNTIYDKYEELVRARSLNEKDAQTIGPTFITWAQTMEDLYEREATELKNISVPAALLESHTKLVNNYLSSKSAMHSLITATTDPASAMGAIIVQSKNTDEEQIILSSIQDIMTKNGIISANP